MNPLLALWGRLGSEGREALVLGILGLLALVIELGIGATSW